MDVAIAIALVIVNLLMYRQVRQLRGVIRGYKKLDEVSQAALRDVNNRLAASEQQARHAWRRVLEAQAEAGALREELRHLDEDDEVPI